MIPASDIAQNVAVNPTADLSQTTPVNLKDKFKSFGLFDFLSSKSTSDDMPPDYYKTF